MVKTINDPEIFSVVDSVCQSFSKKFSFGNYEPSDIYQESFIICIETLLPKYDGVSPLENYLKVGLRNRLLNFKRQKTLYYKFVCPECNNEVEDCEYCVKYRLLFNVKQNLDNPVNIEDIKDDSLYYEHIEEESNTRELYSLINKNLPLSMREDYLKMMNDVYVNKNRRAEIIERIRDILKQNDFLDEENENG